MPNAKAARHVDHVGSLVRPPALMTAWREWEDGKRSLESLVQIEDAAVREAVAMQEEIGLQVVTDGEFRRAGWSRGFLSAVSGLDFRPSRLTFRNDEGIAVPAPAPVAAGKMRRTRPIVSEDFKFLAGVTRRTPKVTMPTPSHMHFGHFNEGFDRNVYKDQDAYWADMIAIYRQEIADLAAAGCRFVQLDEVPLALLCDPQNAAIARDAGEDPVKLADTYIDMINQAVAGRPKDMKIALHLCRGNALGLWMGAGGYEPVAERLFQRADVDRFLLEYDSPRAGDFAPLRHVPKGKEIFLGLVSTKKPDLETADDLARRVDEASRYLAVEQLGVCPQCGFGSAALSKFFPTQNPMNFAVEKAKLAGLVAAAEKIWPNG